MKKKLTKKSAPKVEVVVPNFYIVRWMRDGKEIYRSLFDDVYNLSWNAGESHEQSVKEIERLRLWAKKYSEATFRYILETHLNVTTSETRAHNSLILQSVLQEPYYFNGGQIVYEYEPFEDDDVEYFTNVQRDHQVEVKRQAEEKAKAERLKSAKNKLRNRLSKRFH